MDDDPTAVFRIVFGDLLSSDRRVASWFVIHGGGSL